MLGLRSPETMASHQAGPIAVEERLAYVMMSPQHFKAFVRSLTTTLATYEEVFGPISVEANQEALRRIQDGQPDGDT